MPRLRKRNPLISKRLQTELQALIAFSCYDSKEILQSGKSSKRQTIIDTLLCLYMPSSNDGDDYVSHIDQFLEGLGRFKCLFTKKEDSSDSDNGVPRSKLVLKECFHCVKGKELVVEHDCIDKSLLTRKNLTNYIDIKGDTLYRAAKEVEANCKKALAICLSEDSPYRNYNGTLPSGTNWEDYLVWLKGAMRSSGSNATVTDLVDDAPSSAVDVEGGDTLEEEASNDSESNSDAEEYFKGFFAFALWGYIPPDGGEAFKSSLISTITESKPKREKKNGRRAVKEEELKKNDYLRELEFRGTSASSRAEQQRMDRLISLMVNGCKELSKTRVYKCRISNIEFQLKFTTSRIKEIKEEIKELKDEADSDNDNDEELKDLKEELRKCKQTKKELYIKWKKVSETEESSRTDADEAFEKNCLDEGGGDNSTVNNGNTGNGIGSDGKGDIGSGSGGNSSGGARGDNSDGAGGDNSGGVVDETSGGANKRKHDDLDTSAHFPSEIGIVENDSMESSTSCVTPI